MTSFLKFLIFFLIGAVVGFFFCKWVICPKVDIKEPIVHIPVETRYIQWMPENLSEWSENGEQQVRNIIEKVEGRVAAINGIATMDADQIAKIEELFGNNGKLNTHDGKTKRTGRKIAQHFEKELQDGTVITDFQVRIEYILAYELTHMVIKEPKLDEDIIHSVYFIFSSSYTRDDGRGKIKIDPPGSTSYIHTRLCSDDNNEEG